MPKDLEGEGQIGRHPAYGLVQLGRSQSSSRDVMFGSTMRSSYKMTLSIHAASIRHGLGKDHIFAEEEIIEVAMTSDQLGRMMSSVGMAEGVPCTILRRDMRLVPDPPAIPTEQQRIQDAFDAKMESMARDLRGRLPEIMAILDKEGAINKGDREALRKALAMLHQEVASNAGFAMHQFQESAERVVEAAKAQINTHFQALAGGLPAGADQKPLVIDMGQALRLGPDQGG